MKRDLQKIRNSEEQKVMLDMIPEELLDSRNGNGILLPIEKTFTYL